MKLNNKTNRDNRVIHVSIYTMEVGSLMVSDCQQKQHHGAQLHHVTCTEYHFELACDLVSLKVFFSLIDCYISSKQFPTYSITCLYKSILEIFIRGSVS